MEPIVWSSVSALGLTYGWLAVLRHSANRLGLVDKPDGRKTHKHPTPVIGGVAIFLTLIFVFLLHLFNIINLGDRALLIALVFPLALMGAADDRKHIPARYRFFMQLAISLVIVLVTDTHLHSFGKLFGDTAINLGILAIPMATLAMVAAINAMNMTDGLDGLSGSLVLISVSGLGYVAYEGANQSTLLIIALLVGGVIAHLAFNLRLPGRPRALVFMGDAGSMTFGLLISFFMIKLSQEPLAVMKPVTALWIFAIPLFNIFTITFRRLRRGVSPFDAGRDHLHDDLRSFGLSVNQTVATLALMQLGCVIFGLMGNSYNVPEWQMFAAFVAVFAALNLMPLAFRSTIDNTQTEQTSGQTEQANQQDVKACAKGRKRLSKRATQSA